MALEDPFALSDKKTEIICVEFCHLL